MCPDKERLFYHDDIRLRPHVFLSEDRNGGYCETGDVRNDSFLDNG